MSQRILWCLVAIMWLGVIVLTTCEAHAEPQCNTRDSVGEQLRQKYQETPVQRGLTHDGRMLEIFANEDGSTWSVVITHPGGQRSCLVDAGENWRDALPIEETGDTL